MTASVLSAPEKSGRAPGGDRSQGQRDVIVASLRRIRRRLFSVRLMERLAVGLAWGAALGVVLVVARLLRERLPWAAAGVALLPLLPAAWAWIRAERLRSAIGFTPVMVRTGAVITAVLSAAMMALVFVNAGAAVPGWAIPVVTAGVFLIGAAATVRMISDRAAAIFVDQQANLDERVSTALEMLDAPVESELEAAFREPVIVSALGACQVVRTAKVGYHRLDRRMYAAAALAALVAVGSTLLQPLPAPAQAKRRTTIAVSPQAKQLQEVFKELEEKRPPNDKVTAEKLKPIEHALQQLQQGNMSPIEASAALAEAKEQMKRDQEAMAASDKVQQMLKAMEQTKDFAQAGDELKRADLGQAQDNAQASAQKTAAEQAMADAAKGMGNKLGGMSEGERKDLAKELRSAADKASADPQLQKDLQSAASAAEQGNSQKLSQSMQSAGERMSQQGANQQQSQSSVRQAMSDIDRLQGNGFSQGSQSTMANSGGNQGQQGQQGQNGQEGNQGGQQGGQQGGDQANGNQNGQNGNQGGQQGGAQASGGQGGQQPGNGQAGTGQQTAMDSGSTNFESRGGPGDKHEGGPLGKRTTWVTIYDEKQTNSRGSEEKIGSRIDPLAGPANGSMEVMGRPDDPNSKIRNYADVLPEAKQRAMDELSRQEIPPQYQDLIKAFYQK